MSATPEELSPHVAALVDAGVAIELAEGFEALFAECAPYVYPIPLDDDATEYGAECACGWRVDGVSRETARREADEHGGCDE